MINKKIQYKLALKVVKKMKLSKEKYDEVVKGLHEKIFGGDIFEKENS